MNEYTRVRYKIPGAIVGPEIDAMLDESMEILTEEEWEKATQKGTEEAIHRWAKETPTRPYTATED